VLVNLFWLFVCLRLLSICHNVHTFSVRSKKLSALPRWLLPNHATLFRHGQTYTNMKVMFTVNLSSQYMVPPPPELVLWGSYFLITHCRRLLLTHRIHIYVLLLGYWHPSPSSDRLLRNRRQ
jgi:hypothetical protein